MLYDLAVAPLPFSTSSGRTGLATRTANTLSKPARFLTDENLRPGQSATSTTTTRSAVPSPVFVVVKSGIALRPTQSRLPKGTNSPAAGTVGSGTEKARGLWDAAGDSERSMWDSNFEEGTSHVVRHLVGSDVDMTLVGGQEPSVNADIDANADADARRTDNLTTRPRNSAASVRHQGPVLTSHATVQVAGSGSQMCGEAAGEEEGEDYSDLVATEEDSHLLQDGVKEYQVRSHCASSLSRRERSSADTGLNLRFGGGSGALTLGRSSSALQTSPGLFRFVYRINIHGRDSKCLPRGTRTGRTS